MQQLSSIVESILLESKLGSATKAAAYPKANSNRVKVKPMVSGHVISKPTIKLHRIVEMNDSNNESQNTSNRENLLNSTLQRKSTAYANVAKSNGICSEDAEVPSTSGLVGVSE